MNNKNYVSAHSDLLQGRIVPHGVGLKEGELKALDQIAGTYDVAVNALIRYAVQNIILEIRDGSLDLSSKTRKKNLKRNAKNSNDLIMLVE